MLDLGSSQDIFVVRPICLIQEVPGVALLLRGANAYIPPFDLVEQGHGDLRNAEHTAYYRILPRSRSLLFETLPFFWLGSIRA